MRAWAAQTPTNMQARALTVSDLRLPHLSATGEARMVDVSDKAVTARTATAAGTVLLSQECVAALRDGEVPKGDALAVARIAGIQGAKRTSELIPLCHPLFLSGVDVTTEVTDEGVVIEATVRTTNRTGVEMEALTAVSVAALAMIDMVKAIDRAATITDVRVLAKSGGRRGDWRRDEPGLPKAPGGDIPRDPDQEAETK